VVVFGTTGVGKSSLIQLFCDENRDKIKVSSSSKSTTKKCQLYDEITVTDTDTEGGDNHHNCNSGIHSQSQQRQRYWLDTQGTDDTEMVDCDEKVLKSIFQVLFENAITKVQLIWVVAGDLTTRKSEYERQARFMQALLQRKTNTSASDIWQSCLIIAKQKPLKPSAHSMAGILDIVRNNYGNNSNNPSNPNMIGFTALDWMSNDEKNNNRELVFLRKQAISKEEFAELGFLSNDRIVSEVNARLSNTAVLQLEYLREQCLRCGVIGDHRLIYANCHAVEEHYHPAQKLEWYHPRLGDTQWIHPGQLEISPLAYSKSNAAVLARGSGIGLLSGAVAGGVVAAVAIGTTFLPITLGVVAAAGTAAVGGMCGGAQQLKKLTKKHTVYACCKRNGNRSNGCSLVYSCCGNCACATIKRYSNNNSDNNSDNQNQDWDDKQDQAIPICRCRAVGQAGCTPRYACCGSKLNAIGCEKRCSTCLQPWGDQPGCTTATASNY
jgi:hypothetical protein